MAENNSLSLNSTYFWSIQNLLVCLTESYPHVRFRHRHQDSKIVWVFNPLMLVGQLVWCLLVVVQIAYFWILLTPETSIWGFLLGKFIQAYHCHYPTSRVKAVQLIIKIVDYHQYFWQLNHLGNQIWRLAVHKQGIKLRWDIMKKRKVERIRLNSDLIKW